MDIQNHDELKKYVLSKLKTMKTVRAKSESLRWEACSLVRHRASDFKVDTFYREYEMTADQAIDKFEEDLPNEVLQLQKNKQTTSWLSLFMQFTQERMHMDRMGEN